MSDLRDKIARTISRWCIDTGEEFLPNSLADRIVAIPEIADLIAGRTGAAAVNATIGEALNSGDGTYRP